MLFCLYESRVFQIQNPKVTRLSFPGRQDRDDVLAYTSEAENF